MTDRRRIFLLGGVRIEDVPVAGEKTAALVAFLTLNSQTPYSREILVELLWPHLPSPRARRALSDVLYRLRKSLGAECLITDADHVGLNPRLIWVDASEFLERSSASDVNNWRQAIDLYSGPLAPEVYDDWIAPRRIALHERYLDTLAKLGTLSETEGNTIYALQWFQRLAEAEPLREVAHRGVMQSLARMGRLNEALEAYSRFRSFLWDELSIEPSVDSQRLADHIRSELQLQAGVATSVGLPFVGRAAERSAALTKVEAAIRGQGGALAVEGVAGIGKTRFWEEIATGARWRGATVLITSVPEYQTESPLEPVRELLAQALSGPRAAQMELMLPLETLAVVGELYSPWIGRTRLPELPPAQANRRLQQGLVDVFLGLVGLFPLVIIIDDLHWASPGLWDVIAALLAELPNRPMLVGLTYRRPGIEATHGWPLLLAWERAAKLEIISLEAFTEADIAIVLPDAYRAASDAILSVSSGNPFYITQAIAALDEGISLHPGEEIIRDRLASLLPRDRAALETASVLGMSVPFQLWSMVVEETDLSQLVISADLLVVHRFLQPVEGGYAFVHDLIQEIIYEQLQPDRRRSLHVRAAQAWRRFDPANAYVLAFHLDRADQLSEAASFYRQAGINNLRIFAFAEARVAFERALELWPSTPAPERVSTLFDIAQIGDSTGDRDRQHSALTEALQNAQKLEHDQFMLQALIGLGRLAAVTGHVDVATKHLSDAVDLADQVQDDSLSFEAYFYTGDLEARRGRLEASRQYFERALRQARKASDPLNEARALRGLSIVARLSGDPAQAMGLIEQALTLQLANGDLFGASVTQTNLVATFYDLAAWDRVIELAGEALDLKERLRDQHGAAIMRHMRGLAAYSLGDLEQAREALTAGLQGFDVVQDRRTAGLARNVLGLVAEAEGDDATAEQDFESAISIADSVNAATEAAYARHDLGALLVRLNQPQEAIALLEAAIDTWQAIGNDLLRLKSEAFLGLAVMTIDRRRAETLAKEGWQAFEGNMPAGEALQAWLWSLHQLLTGLDRPIEAETVLRSAYAELLRQAGAIRDLGQRRHFFARVSLNREIVSAYHRIASINPKVTCSLVRVGVPTGRRLVAEDFITVTWTVVAPEDELIAEPAERRRYILRRLLDEATAQGAAPTDDDLAITLGVSRRTIVRDIQALAQLGQPITTRRRKKPRFVTLE